MADVNNSKLFQKIEGIDQAADALVVLVKTEWNSDIVDELESGCLRVLSRYGVAAKTLVVPGAVEIPFAVKQCSAGLPAATAFIALGCIIRGDTPHFDYVCQAVTSGITQLNLSLRVPVVFGVLTVNTAEQAKERIGGAHGHKGEEAAITALKNDGAHGTIKTRQACMTIQLFIPCFVDQLYPQSAFNMVSVLEKAGCEVLYNAKQTCCGQPAFNAGFGTTQKTFAKVYQRLQWWPNTL